MDNYAAHNIAPPGPVVPSPLYAGLLFCPGCHGHYKPGMEWGYRAAGHDDDTTGKQYLVGLTRLGDECPFCGNRPLAEPEKS
jgi:hypothetical protein